MLYRNLLAMFALLLVFTGCNKDEGPLNTTLPNESEVLVKHLEANGDYTNTPPAMITAQQIREGQLNGNKQIVIDLRTVCDYSTLGHIEGAVLLSLRQVPDYYKNNNLSTYEKVIITDWTGQGAGYAASLLRMAGYNNVYSMMWGMSSWNKVFDVWSEATSDGGASQIETTAHEKGAEGNLPKLNTGKTNAADILKARSEDLMSTGFDNVQVTLETVLRDKDQYYIIDYASVEAYNAGHLPGAVHYTPQQDFRLSTYLKTIPPDKPVVVYCTTGQTSAHLAAYLKLLGYDVKSLLYGRNGFIYSTMTGKKFTAAEVNDYPFVVH